MPEWGPLVGARLRGVARAAPLVGRRRAGMGMALLLCLVGVTAALAHGCLHCHSKFSEKFSFYRHHVNLKSWWVGDIPVSGALLTDWSDDTMKELHLAIPAEISECRSPAQSRLPPQRDPRAGQSPGCFSCPQPGRSWTKWRQRCTREWISCTRGRCTSRVRGAKPRRGPPTPGHPAHRLSLTFSCLDSSGYFPNELRNIFREQVRLIQNAIIESEQIRLQGREVLPRASETHGAWLRLERCEQGTWHRAAGEEGSSPGRDPAQPLKDQCHHPAGPPLSSPQRRWEYRHALP